MSLNPDKLGHISISAVDKEPSGQRFDLGEGGRQQEGRRRGEGGADWGGGLQGSENRSASVQTESYLRGGANRMEEGSTTWSPGSPSQHQPQKARGPHPPSHSTQQELRGALSQQL